MLFKSKAFEIEVTRLYAYARLGAKELFIEGHRREQGDRLVEIFRKPGEMNAYFGRLHLLLNRA